MKNWLDTKEYPFRSEFFEVNNHRIHYIDEGEGQTILFVHGTPSWSFEYRHLVKTLRKDYRCVAMDHMGFGLSDKPHPYDYSIQNHCRTFEEFVLGLQLKDIILVVHDFGGPIGLNFAIRHPARVQKIVVLNSWLWSTKHEPEFKKLSRVLKSPLLPFLYLYLNFSAKYLLPKSFGDKKISRRILKQYTAPFPRKNQRHGPLSFARSLLNDQDWFEELWQQREKISGKEVLFLWGMKDPYLKVGFLQKFREGFPNSTALELVASGHFPQEEQPQTLALEMKAWLESTKPGVR